MRLMQHKREAYYFYSFLSIFYDKFVNPLFWTERMRDASLELADLNDKNLTVIDVGSGTGFTTLGIVKKIDPHQVACVDQSPHQMAKAKAKPELQNCTFHLGDAENIPFPTDYFDRYVSAGSIEYWPDPARGIREAYRVIKPGGIALMIGPLEPQSASGRFIAETWMLFPKDEEYRKWFEEAGFEDVQATYIRPHWYRRKAEYGIAIAGRKPRPGLSPGAIAAEPVLEEKWTLGRRLQLLGRVVVGSIAGFAFIPAALWGYLVTPAPPGGRLPDERLNGYQWSALAALIFLVLFLIWLLSGC